MKNLIIILAFAISFNGVARLYKDKNHNVKKELRFETKATNKIYYA